VYFTEVVLSKDWNKTPEEGRHNFWPILFCGFLALIIFSAMWGLPIVRDLRRMCGLMIFPIFVGLYIPTVISLACFLDRGNGEGNCQMAIPFFTGLPSSFYASTAFSFLVLWLFKRCDCWVLEKPVCNTVLGITTLVSFNMFLTIAPQFFFPLSYVFPPLSWVPFIISFVVSYIFVMVGFLEPSIGRVKAFRGKLKDEEAAKETELTTNKDQEQPTEE